MPGICKKHLSALCPVLAVHVSCEYFAVNVLQKRKLGILNFTAAAGLEPGAALLLYLIAAAEPQDSVSRYCLQLLPCLPELPLSWTLLS
jgi:hypothetical protein